jgi:hypothetical protein
MSRIEGHPINTETRAGRMLDGLVKADHMRGKVVLTVELISAGNERGLHEAFKIKKWEGRDSFMLSVSVGEYPYSQNVLVVNLASGRVLNARGCTDPLMRYAAEAALEYAWLGETRKPKNGRIVVEEQSTCGACGRELTDPESIRRGIGPECYGKQTGSKTIRSARQPELATA